MSGRDLNAAGHRQYHAPPAPSKRPEARLWRLALAAALALALPAAQAAEVVAAVAANFAPAMTRLEPAFEQASGHRLIVVLGSSGRFLQQIRHGAPFDVLLSADVERPELLAKSGLGVPASRFTYAVGRLALWSPDPQAIGDGPAYLRAGPFRHLAIANPAVAPYGVAAQQVLEKLGLWSTVQERIVRGEDIGQVYAMVASGAAQAGFVALSSVLVGAQSGSHWPVPPELHAPLKQDAILLARARDNPAAQALLDYLRTPAARAVIASLGYGLADPAP
jgi:molybdate transport system substrate-binding protein